MAPKRATANEADPLQPRGQLLSKSLAVEIRIGFVRKVFSVLAIQLLVTFAIAIPIMFGSRSLKGKSMHILWAIGLGGGMIMLTTMHCCQGVVRSYPWMILLGFSAFKGLLFGALSAQYTWQSLLLALGVAVLVFVSMSIYACYTKIDYTGYAPYFHAAFMTFFIFGIVLMIMGICGIHISWVRIIFDCVGVLLFTGLILLDTQRILGEWGGHQYQFSVDDWMFAALALYIDFTHVFMHLLRLMGVRTPH